MNYFKKRTGTVQNTINNNNNEADPKITLIHTLCVDKNLNPTENRDFTGFSSLSNMILLLNIDQKINIPKDFSKIENELKVYNSGGQTTHILIYYERCWYVSNFNSSNKPLEKKYTRYIQSKKHIAVKVRFIVGQYIRGKLGNTIQVFVLSEYIDKLKRAGLPYLPLQKVLDDNVEEPLDLLECLAQKFTDVDISKQEIKLFMDAGTSFKPRDVPIDVDGANIARNVVVRLLKSLIIYMGIYNIEDKHGVIEHLHRVKKNVRVHKRVERGMKQKTKKLEVKNSTIPQKDISLRDFNTTVEQLKIQLGSKNSMHSFNIDQIYSMRKDKKLFHYLSLFMDLKAAIDPSIATPVDLVNYILSNPKGSDCLDALIATFVLHRHKLPKKQIQKVEIFNLFGPIAEKWFDFFIKLLHGASGKNKCALVQVLTPWIIQKLYHPRDIAMLSINIISERDFGGIPIHRHPNQIFIIVLQNGYRIYIKQNKNKRNKDLRYDPDIDKIVVDKDEENLLKYIHMAIIYKAETNT